MCTHCHAQDAARQLQEEAAALAEQRKLREANLAPDRPDEAALRKLDASVKRNTALTKKLRGVTEEARTGLLEEIQRTNQAKVWHAQACALPEPAFHIPAACMLCSCAGAGRL